MKIFPFCGLLSASLLVACAYPSTSVTVLDEKPHLQFTGAPLDADLIIDGALVGKAHEFDGRTRVLAISSGTHHIVVQDTHRPLYVSDIYLGKDMTKIIAIPE